MTSSPLIRLSLIAGRRHDRPTQPSATSALLHQVGHDEAVNSLLEQHVDAVYRFALRLTRDSQRAWDLTQETMLRGWRRRDQLREVQAARVWLFRIATNLYRDQLRRRSDEVELVVEPTEEVVVAQLRLQQREDVQRALRALDELPDRQRQVMHLITIEKLTHDQTAEAIGISVGAVKSNLAAARKTMRCKLKDLYDELRGVRTE